MGVKHNFDIETDSARLAMDLMEFLKKWGLWEGVQIFTGGKCYRDDCEGIFVVYDEPNPEESLRGLTGERDCNGHLMWKDFSNPEHLFDMIFEGPLSLLLRHHEYEVRTEDLSAEVKKELFPVEITVEDQMMQQVEEYTEQKLVYGWDPAEYDSYEEWQKLTQYASIVDVSAEEEMKKLYGEDIAVEDYDRFLLYAASVIEGKLNACAEDDVEEPEDIPAMFYDDGKLAYRVLSEFDAILEKYGLWYELGFCWSLTTYRI